VEKATIGGALSLVASPLWTTLLAADGIVIRAQALISLLAPKNAAAAALFERNAVIVKHLLACQMAARAPTETSPRIVRSGYFGSGIDRRGHVGHDLTLL
jgi:hypothetical protein